MTKEIVADGRKYRVGVVILIEVGYVLGGVLAGLAYYWLNGSVGNSVVIGVGLVVLLNVFALMKFLRTRNSKR